MLRKFQIFMKQLDFYKCYIFIFDIISRKKPNRPVSFWQLVKGNFTEVVGRLTGGAPCPPTLVNSTPPTGRKRWTSITHTILSTFPPSKSRAEYLPPHSNSPATERLLQLSQWEAMIHGTPSLLQWSFLLRTVPQVSPLSSMKVPPLLCSPNMFVVLPYLPSPKLQFFAIPE